jgi:hypothetical protein
LHRLRYHERVQGVIVEDSGFCVNGRHLPTIRDNPTIRKTV